ncbi:OsmC family protein [Listeria floridensis FSL S10-1187]|uniref:OsmC family protein n=1 Tax=Listeria floridensis FSL S10-1187 TaxID=1265817 RepID=A0ABP3AXJ6_9LIST|nr:OsmC family protein [Listeria floridensis]EUJ28043.1 OsmC family protein [Listeria floridensis FSL S10-1187]
MHLEMKEEGTIELFHESGNWKLRKEMGFSPVQMTAAAAAACSGYVYAKILRKKRVLYDILEIEVDYTQNLTERVHTIKTIDIRFKIKTTSENREQAEKAVHLVKQGCPVAMSLHPDIEITEQVEFIEE